ncbi:hypothetical protein, partial [Denitromonas iodatirespirans]|uniref:hypothetical protein n=1 Tax=Denitromonas iodatirespirans TaxID=2795389 RepID=UPI001BDBD941
SGGSNRATALSLNACPYLATSFFSYRPSVSDSIEATTILTQGEAGVAVGKEQLGMAMRLPEAAQHRQGRTGQRHQAVLVALGVT